ncbi:MULTISPECIES: undecaprenyldiphospho-muramoylpentapeptide beta-N-acetylglucosaminyltransferase [Planococcus]|uniref:UDP-N-acetylglucosamine--N-acetylmuramyl-(pentapeptide) pyrophosphoryl-undecaprenol N-acetylglucosamine transferase n=1 Tax=Planococcus faecalis TaxID=1598147 RepID=A0ABN4XRQ2_9BACL|nr:MULTISPECIES: undecaprenyldiphospho-muramoylpentapeptide beta-N-acetylglucosaminyltransferase [Planococcus]AQU79432.1 undecaprenyldiphospho-muramoylpentapeptide beta-N-acetylglucosaminyltransferase [Planococcus faecalis]MDJ0332510.1 undecaprenyldiphospho-muramoylpentapeptide beta-N-acetylglucosaminyltransferase [Planococcus sp. S3-L1]OHX51401.1 UDP-N-acetylglucosamine--N-acetylmuramyl-(pentapeptide) pyrophosphoryl-undecaprenol N-acetylglucosamine transferase [Planococcus faecalis]
MNNKTILLTGGGTAGHVSLNQALIPELKNLGFNVEYIGSKDGIENELIRESFPSVPYHAISSGKLRRYFSTKNFSDPFRVGAGLMQAVAIIRKTKPVAIFSKGGFVSVPVVMAGRMMSIPVIIHESDVTPGLANKIALPFADHIFTVFKETLAHVPSSKSTCTGSLIRSELMEGSAIKGQEICSFDNDLPVLLIMGGSQGSAMINSAVRNNLERLLKQVNIIHLCGKGNYMTELDHHSNYRQFEYVTHELPHLLHLTDFVVSRAGSNSIFEFLALKKPMLLVPLSMQKSRGDQILNANLFEKQGFAHVVEEEQLSADRFMEELERLQTDKEQLITAMTQAEAPITAAEMAKLVAVHTK